MSEAQAEKSEAQTPAAKKPAPQTEAKPAYSRRTLRKMGRDKRQTRIHNDAEYKKARDEEKSNNSSARKVAFRRRHAKQK